MRNYSRNATYLTTVLLFSFVVMLLITSSKCEAISNNMQPLEARIADLIPQFKTIFGFSGVRCPAGYKYIGNNKCKKIKQ